VLVIDDSEKISHYGILDEKGESSGKWITGQKEAAFFHIFMTEPIIDFPP